jgi:DNA repair photolyase
VYPVTTPEVIILDRVRDDPRAAARLKRMMAGITADRVVEVDDAGLAEIFQARGWSRASKRTGAYRMTGAPALIFSTFRWLSPAEFEKLDTKHPTLRGPLLLGGGAWTFRDRERHLAENCVCQSAYEIHCAYGCLHACDYCHIPPYYIIMLDLEELAGRIREFGETIPWQKLYKFDNQTDTICLEPEYGASETMVRMFADWPDRYLMLYTKSDNVDHLLGLDHKGRTLISWSLSCDTVAEKIEKRTPSNERRIRAIERCERAGYPVRVRISPICPVRNWREEYAEMIGRLLAVTRPQVISIDVIGWMTAAQMKDALDTSLFDEAYAAELDRLEAEGAGPRWKHLFPHEMRAEILRFVIEEIKRRRPKQPVSFCMETTDMWQELGPTIGMSPDHYACCCGPTSVPGHPLLRSA